MDDHLAYYRTLPALAAAVPTAPEILARTIYRTTTHAVLSVRARLDTAGNLYLAARLLRGNDTPVPVWRITPANEWTLLATVRPNENNKGDDLELLIGGPTGRDLILLLGTHRAVSDPNRDNDVQIAEIPGVVLAPGVPEGPGEGLIFDSRALGEAEPPPEPGTEVDYARIQAGAVAAAAGEVNRLIGLFGSGSIRQALEDKAKDALVELLTAVDDPRGQAYREALSTFLHDNAGLYNRLRETMYEVLRDNGLIPPPPAPKE